MAATREMVDIALKARPHAACIVPERRQEVTTEGGLDVVRQHNHLVPIIAELKVAGIRVSLFIAADQKQIETAAEVGAPVVEIHTGAWCEAVIDGHDTMAEIEFDRIKKGAARAKQLGLEVHAGHGRSEEHTSELQSHLNLVCRLLLEKKKKQHPSEYVT